jgi:hypothetical protein
MIDHLGVAREIVVEREGKPTLRGHYWVRENIVTVTSEDGRQKSTQAATPADRHRRLILVRKWPPIGRLERQLRRILLSANKALSTPELAERLPRPTHSGSIRRAAKRFAVPLYRRRSRGMPIVWVLANDRKSKP